MPLTCDYALSVPPLSGRNGRVSPFLPPQRVPRTAGPAEPHPGCTGSEVAPADAHSPHQLHAPGERVTHPLRSGRHAGATPSAASTVSTQARARPSNGVHSTHAPRSATPPLGSSFTPSSATGPRPSRPLPSLPACAPSLAPIPLPLAHLLAQQNDLSVLNSMGQQRLRPLPWSPVTRSEWSDSDVRMAARLAALPAAQCPITHKRVVTPLITTRWAHWLAASGYPTRVSQFLIRGIRLGVPIGFGGLRNVRQDAHNGSSVTRYAEKVAEAIREELANGRRIGPFPIPPFPSFRLSPIAVVPKKPNAQGEVKLRIVHDLSSPAGSSVNEWISHTSVAIASFDNMMGMVTRLGAGCLIFKIDVSAAYRCIPVRPEDWPLLGLKWEHGSVFDTVLPFGLGSSCLLFEAFASAANHIVRYRYEQREWARLVMCEHYIDDTVGVIAKGEQQDAIAAEVVSLTDSTMRDELGIPLSDSKFVPPSTVCIVLGIEVDTVRMRASLGEERLLEVRALTQEWRTRDHCTRRQLERRKLIGVLQFASRVVRPGRVMLNRLFTLLRTMGSDRKAIRSVSAEARQDIAWWHHHVAQWDGISLLYEEEWAHARALGLQVNLSTDACSAGFGAAWGSEWIHGTWNKGDLEEAQRAKTISMPYLELKALVIAAATWGKHWARKRVLFSSDCLSAAQAINSGSSPQPDTARLLRTLARIAASSHFEYRCEHIAGITNVAADLLSRGQAQQFLDSHPGASRSPTTPSPLPTSHW